MLNWLVIGIGDITTKRVIPAILEEPRSNFYGVVTRDASKAAPYKVKVFGDITKALIDSAINAVYVASPVFLHAPQTIQALHAGRDVLCEKPVAMNYAETLTMVAAAKSAGKTLGISYYRRTYPKVHRAMQLIKQGVIGQPVMAYVTCHGWSAPEGGPRGWLVDPAKAGGGPLFDIASHRIDLLNYIFGDPQRATGQISNAVHQTAVEDNATVLIEYKNKARGIVDVRWNSKIDRDEFRMIGTEGEMDLTPLNGPELVYPGGREQIPTHSNIHYPCVKNFVDAVLDGAPLLSSGATAAWTDWVTQQVQLVKGS